MITNAKPSVKVAVQYKGEKIDNLAEVAEVIIDAEVIDDAEVIIDDAESEFYARKEYLADKYGFRAWMFQVRGQHDKVKSRLDPNTEPIQKAIKTIQEEEEKVRKLSPEDKRKRKATVDNLKMIMLQPGYFHPHHYFRMLHKLAQYEYEFEALEYYLQWQMNFLQVRYQMLPPKCSNFIVVPETEPLIGANGQHVHVFEGKKEQGGPFGNKVTYRRGGVFRVNEHLFLKPTWVRIVAFKDEEMTDSEWVSAYRMSKYHNSSIRRRLYQSLSWREKIKYHCDRLRGRRPPNPFAY